MFLEVKSDYQKSSWFKRLFHETNLGFGGLSRGLGGMLPQKILKMEPLRLAKNAFPAYSYGHEVS